MAKYDYNIVVIGGGSAGLVSSYIAAAVKAKVALVERHQMGGDCLNTGCVPSKALIRSAKIFSYLKHANDFGLHAEKIGCDFEKVMDRVQSIIKEIEPHDSVERYTKLGVECFSGNAKIVSPHEVDVDGKILTAKSIIIAAGASPLVPPIPGLDDIPYLTSDNIWDIRSLPKKLIVLGGGPIGCELAQSFARFGSEVTQVEMLPEILIREDEEVATTVREKLKADGVKVLTNHKAMSFAKSKNGVTLTAEHNGKDVEIKGSAVLLALGRKANVASLGLDELGIELAPQGTIQGDAFLRTNIKNIYVCGDIVGPYQFTHVAAHQAWYASVNALFTPFKKFKVDYRVIPWATFTDPEVARVGLNEKEAKEQNIPYEVTTYDLSDLDRAITDGVNQGFVKVLTKPGKDVILGVTIVGHHAGDYIAEFVMAMKHGLGLKKILGTIHIYPTLAEANKFAAGEWQKNHVPCWALHMLQCFHKLRR